MSLPLFSPVVSLTVREITVTTAGMVVWYHTIPQLIIIFLDEQHF